MLPVPAVTQTKAHNQQARLNIVRDTIKAIRRHISNPEPIVTKYLLATINGTTINDLLIISKQYVDLHVVS